ncbi:MAG TPA: hypothetical protein VKR06_05625 [Ktedonosporobacter sp.]|nr:hypothetical protein [Ktedonosporobacter sp.]
MAEQAEERPPTARSRRQRSKTEVSSSGQEPQKSSGTKKAPPQTEAPKEAQPVDGALKWLYGEDADHLVKEFFPGITLKGRPSDDLNIEIDRSTLKCDLVYNVYNEEEQQDEILDLELETDWRKDFLLRVSVYAAELRYKHKKFVRLGILLPFATRFPEPPFVVRAKKSGKISALQDYEVILLCKLDAREFIEHGHVSTYSLLPAMKHASVSLLKQALAKMRAAYPDSKFGKYLNCFYQLAMRSSTMSEPGKKKIKEVVNVQYHLDWLLKDNDVVAQLNQQAREEGLEEGLEKGMQRSILQVIRSRFPTLVAVAEPRIQQIHQTEELTKLLDQMVLAPDEGAAITLLRLPSA